MSILQDYWNIPDPVRLNKVEDRPSNREALLFGAKISTILTGVLFLGLFVGLLL